MRTALICLVLVLVTIAAYWRVHRNDFVYFDDNLYVTENPLVQSGLTTKGVIWALTTVDPPYWQPLTRLSHMVDCELFGLEPAAHHLVSVLLHIASSVLLFLVFFRMTGDIWPSAFIAAVFAVHPLHVESVAWIAERKDVLSAFFLVLCLWAYVRYVERSRMGWYGLALLTAALALMSKPMVVTLPCLMLLLDYWPLRRWRPGDREPALRGADHRFPAHSLSRLLLEKIPFVLLVIPVCVVTFLNQSTAGVVTSMEELPIGGRLVNALLGYTRYLANTIRPVDLAVFYDELQDPWAWIVVGFTVVVGISVLAVRARRGHPHLLVGWLWYLGTLVPVVGFVQVWRQSIADRFMYIPMIGLLVMVAWSVPRAWTRRRGGRIALASLAAAIIGACAVLTSLQLRHWHNTQTLFEHAMTVTVDNTVAINNVAWIYAAHPDPEMRDPPKALELARRLCRLSKFQDPSDVDTLGVALAAMGRYPEAIVVAQTAIAMLEALGATESAAPIRERLRLYRQQQPYVERNHLITGAAPEPPPPSDSKSRWWDSNPRPSGL